MKYYDRAQEEKEETRLENEGGVEVRHMRANLSVVIKIDHATLSASWHLVGDGGHISPEPFHITGDVEGPGWNATVGLIRAASNMVKELDSPPRDHVG